jgi:transposase
LAWKRDEVALRRFVEAALWICRTGAPWRDLPEALGFMVQRYHRWCRRGW